MSVVVVVMVVVVIMTKMIDVGYGSKDDGGRGSYGYVGDSGSGADGNRSGDDTGGGEDDRHS